MRISASISSLQKRQIPDTVSMLDQAGVNFYHLDSVENREIFDFAKSLGEITQTPMDLHLITSDPVKYWDEIRESGIEAIVIQLEALHSTLIIPDDMRGKVGLAILATSSPELFKPYEIVASSLLIMTTTPGYSGGKFQKEQFANIIRFRFMYPKVPLIVDGGVTAEISSVLTFMGIPQVVSGSYLFSAETVFETVSKLRDKPIMHWKVSDISLSEPELLQAFSLRLPIIPVIVIFMFLSFIIIGPPYQTFDKMYMLKISVNDKKAEDSYCLRGAVCLDGHNEETIELMNRSREDLSSATCRHSLIRR